MPRWIIEYIYQGEDGKTSLSFSKISAPTKEVARNLAAKRAPFEEFIITVYPQSDEQFLNTVSQQAKIMSGQSTTTIPDPEDSEEQE